MMLWCVKAPDKDEREACAADGDAIVGPIIQGAIEPSARIGLHLPSQP